MNCDGLLNALGYECRQVRSGAITVSTPFTFADGEPISFYLDQGPAGAVVLTDNSDTMMHLGGIGWDLTSGRTWRSIRQCISPFGLELIETGEIVGKAMSDQQSVLVASYVAAMLGVVELEKEFLGLTQEQSQYIAEVEMYLQAWKPNEKVLPMPTFKGHSGRTQQFHFQQGNTLIDAARPHGARTGSILRKSIDVRNLGTNLEIMVVMDDREDPERARAETDILTTFVSVMTFTRLVQQAGGSKAQQ